MRVSSGGGLTTVTTDATLTGAGTSGSPLKVALPATVDQVPGFIGPASVVTAANYAMTANGTNVWGLALPKLVTNQGIVVYVTVADGVGLYSFGVYNSSGVLQLSSTARHVAATGLNTFAWSQTLPFVLPAGLYFIAGTGTATTLNFQGFNSGQQNPITYASQNAVAGGTTVSGALNASGLTMPTFSPLQGGMLVFSIY